MQSASAGIEVVGQDDPGRRRRRYAPAPGRPPSRPAGSAPRTGATSVWRITKTMKNSIVLSIGSESRPCWRTAVWRSEPACWKAATRRSVPEPGHAAEDDGRDRRRDDRRQDAAEQPADGHVGDTEVASHEQQRDQADDGADDPDRDQVADDREERPGRGRVAEERERPVRVERQEPVEADARRARPRRRPRRRASRVGSVFGRLRNQPIWPRSPATKPDLTRRRRRTARRSRVERRRQDVGPDRGSPAGPSRAPGSGRPARRRGSSRSNRGRSGPSGRSPTVWPSTMLMAIAIGISTIVRVSNRPQLMMVRPPVDASGRIRRPLPSPFASVPRPGGPPPVLRRVR